MVFLYTNENPYIVKVLKDQDYWNVLDRLSHDETSPLRRTLCSSADRPYVCKLTNIMFRQLRTLCSCADY